MKTWIQNRLREKSTWAAIIGAVAGIAGYSIGDEQIANIAMGVATIVGLFLAKESGDPSTPRNNLSADDLVSLRKLRELQTQSKTNHQPNGNRVGRGRSIGNS